MPKLHDPTLIEPSSAVNVKAKQSDPTQAEIGMQRTMLSKDQQVAEEKTNLAK